MSAASKSQRSADARSAKASAKVVVPAVHRVEAHLARRFHQVCLGTLAEVTEVESLSPMEYGVLGSLDDAPGIDQRRLADRVGIDVVTAHHLVERLERLGLVKRQVDPADRRSRMLQLTPAGIKLRRQLRPRVLAAQDRMTASLSAAERRILVELLARIIESNDVYARPGNGRRSRKKKSLDD
jgi:MarR family transcriptional regulator, temperature-dependent positive regulator of motility